MSRIRELEMELTEVKRHLTDARLELKENTEYYEKRLTENERERETYINRALLVEDDNTTLNNESERLKAANQQLVDTLSQQVAVALELEQLINNYAASVLVHADPSIPAVYPPGNMDSDVDESLPEDIEVNESLPPQAMAAASAAKMSPAVEADSSPKERVSAAASAQTDEGVCDNSRLSLSVISDPFLLSTVTDADQTLLDSTLAEPISDVTHVTDFRVSEAVDIHIRLQAAIKQLIEILTHTRARLEELGTTVVKEGAEKAEIITQHGEELKQLSAEHSSLVEELQSHQDESATLNKELDEMKAELQRLVHENDSLSAQYQQTELDRALAVEAKDQAVGRLRQVEEIREQLISEMDRLVEKSKVIELNQQRVEEENQSLNEKVAELEEEVSGLTRENDALSNRLDMVESEEGMQRKLADAEHDLADKELFISQLQENEAKLTDTIKQLSALREEEAKTANSIQGKLEEMEAYASQLEAEKATLEEKLANLQSEDLGQLKSELSRMQQQFDSIDTTISTLEGDKKVLKQELANKQVELLEEQERNAEMALTLNSHKTQAELEARELQVKVRNTKKERDEAYRLLESQKSGRLSFDQVVGMVRIRSFTPSGSTEELDTSGDCESEEVEQERERSPLQENIKLKGEISQLQHEIEVLKSQLGQVAVNKLRLEYQQPVQIKLLQLHAQAKSVGGLRERRRWQKEMLKSKKLPQPVVDAMIESQELDDISEEKIKEDIMKLTELVTIDSSVESGEEIDAKDTKEIMEELKDKQVQLQDAAREYEKQIMEREDAIRQLKAENGLLANEVEEKQKLLDELQAQLVIQTERQQREEIARDLRENSRIKDRLESVEEELAVTQEQLALKEEEVMELEQSERKLEEQLAEKLQLCNDLNNTVDQLETELNEKELLTNDLEEQLRVWALSEITYQRQIASLTGKLPNKHQEIGTMTENIVDVEKTRMGAQLTELERMLGEARHHADQLDCDMEESKRELLSAKQQAEKLERQLETVTAERDTLQEVG
jgi:chromosome segregation ATPase